MVLPLLGQKNQSPDVYHFQAEIPAVTLFQQIADLRSFIRTEAPKFVISASVPAERWTGLCPPCSRPLVRDVLLIDVMYRKALALSRGRVREALFICTIATMTHRHVPLFIGINIPLTTENDSLYSSRIQALPRYIFTDSKLSGFGDADKLQHFFGSAYLALATDTFLLAETAGWLIEIAETWFVREETFDTRDARSNALGRTFAALLEHNPDSVPSPLFIWWNMTGTIPEH